MHTQKLKRVILLVETSRAFGRDLLHGIARYSRIHGPWSFYREPRDLKSRNPKFSKWNVNGIIMRNSLTNSKLVGLKKPTILVLHDAERPKKFPAVVTDYESIAKLAIDHLQGLGLHQFAFCGFDSMIWSNERKLEFERLVTEKGFHSYIYKQPEPNKYDDWNTELRYMAKWLRSLPTPIGILACNDDRGQHVSESCKFSGLSVPDEVAIIGVDDDTILCELCDPPLSSIAMNTEEAGYMSAQLLNSLMNGVKMRGQEIVVWATRVVKRQSTDVLAIDDDNGANAIRFIRRNAKNRIHVDDIIAQTSLSRRNLEIQFRKYLHHTIHQELYHTRIDLMRQMVAEKDLPISEITSSFTFTDIAHVSRFFKRETGISMKSYRELKRRGVRLANPATL